ncbi:MAG: hypothetical protein IKN47_07335 [Lachnospiraceae bacterium]|nr:hypothetical protein [Lachnospiraceae bacterium]
MEEQFTDKVREAYIPYDNGFQKAAGIMGIAAIATTFFGLIMLPMMLGGLAVILALLSRGKGYMSRRAYMGFTCGSVAIILNILIVGYALFMFCFNPVFRSTVNEQSRRMYGYTINDMINESVGNDFDVDSYLRDITKKFMLN